MKTRSVIVLLLFDLSMMGAGYLVGWHRAALAGASAENSHRISGKNAGENSPLPSAIKPLAASQPVSASATPGKTSLAEMEAKMLKLNLHDMYGDPEWRKMLDNLDPADIPQLLAFVDAKVPKSLRQGLRFNLLSRWAQNDSQAALAYAQALPNSQERQNAIGMVASGWAQKDPVAAAAWAQQLPKGQLRDHVLSSVISAMAGSNPQAAFDLIQS